MQVSVVARDRGPFDGRVLGILRELLKVLIDLLVYQIALLDPTLGATGNADLRKPAFPLKDLDAISVLGNAHLVVDLCELIAKCDLWGGNVVDLQHALAVSAAGGKEDRRGEGEEEQFSGGNFHRSRNL